MGYLGLLDTSADELFCALENASEVVANHEHKHSRDERKRKQALPH
jgi:hypothetical protein